MQDDHRSGDGGTGCQRVTRSDTDSTTTPDERSMKVSIIGGGGLVGSCTAFALQIGGVVREIALLDVNAELAAGQALDLLHGASLMADQVITLRRLRARFPTSDLICITAGLRRKPDESRLDLINRNVDLFLGILGQVKPGRATSTTRSCWSSRTRSTC